MPKKFTGLISVIIVTLIGLSACNEKVDPSDYFPLEHGLNWKYHYQLTSAKKSKEGIYTVTNIGTESINNETVTVRRTNNGRDYYLAKKPDGIYRYASRTLFETNPRIDSTPRMVLPFPYINDMNDRNKDDRRWSSTSTSYVIHMIGPSTISSANSRKKFKMNYRISAKNETVFVPAGKFENCLLVEGEAMLTMFTDPHTGHQDIPIKTREWYAPGVGLIKLERTEPLDTRIYKGGSYLFELMTFNR